MTAPSPSSLPLIGAEIRRDYVRRHLGARLHHLFRANDGAVIGCAGPGFCVQCQREGRQ